MSYSFSEHIGDGIITTFPFTFVGNFLFSLNCSSTYVSVSIISSNSYSSIHSFGITNPSSCVNLFMWKCYWYWLHLYLNIFTYWKISCPNDLNKLVLAAILLAIEMAKIAIQVSMKNPIIIKFCRECVFVFFISFY